MTTARYRPTWDLVLDPLVSCKLCLGEYPVEQMTTIAQCQCIFCTLVSLLILFIYLLGVANNAQFLAAEIICVSAESVSPEVLMRHWAWILLLRAWHKYQWIDFSVFLFFCFCLKQKKRLSNLVYRCLQLCSYVLLTFPLPVYLSATWIFSSHELACY